MSKRNQVLGELEENKEQFNEQNNSKFLRKKSIKELIAPDGIDVSDISNLKIISNTTKYAKSFYVSVLPRMCTFP